MKKISILLSVLALSVMGQAQQSLKSASNPKYKPTAVTEAERMAAGRQQTNSADRGGATVLFTEDFSQGWNGSTAAGAWTHEDSGSTPIWMVATAASPAGEFSTNIDPLASPSAANGWVIFDCDLYNTPVADGTVEDVQGWIVTPTLDFTNNESVIVEYYQYFRYCCFSPSPLTLEVSIDGGTTWSASFPAHGTFTPSANTLSANPLKTTVDVSCAAAGQSNVKIRWAYNSANDAGYSHYFWGIDDITIYENNIANDLEVFQVTNGDVFNVWEYRVTPLEQAPVAADGGLLAGIIYKNNGYNDQPNTTITVDILDATQTNVLYTTTEAPFDMPSYGNTPECPSYLYDTLYVSTNWVPTATGLYYIRATISSDSTDIVPDNNVMLKDIEYTIAEYGHDNPDSLNVQIGPRETDTGSGVYDPCGYGNFFHFPNDGSTAYGVTARFGSNTDPLTIFQSVLYQTNGDLNGAGEVVASKEFEMTQGWIDNSDAYAQYFPFEQSFQPLTGEAYFAAVLNENESSEQLTIQAWDNSDTDNSTGSYEQSGAGDFVWFSSQNWTPAVRLILEERVGVTEEKTALLNNFMVTPNPASNDARLIFNLNGSHYLAYEVRDMNGRLVEFSNLGRFYAGQNILNLNVSKYPVGQYSVGIVVDGVSMYRQNMLIVR